MGSQQKWDNKRYTADMKRRVKQRLTDRYPAKAAPFTYKVNPDGTVERVQS